MHAASRWALPFLVGWASVASAAEPHAERVHADHGLLAGPLRLGLTLGAGPTGSAAIGIVTPALSVGGELRLRYADTLQVVLRARASHDVVEHSADPTRHGGWIAGAGGADLDLVRGESFVGGPSVRFDARENTPSGEERSVELLGGPSLELRGDDDRRLRVLASWYYKALELDDDLPKRRGVTRKLRGKAYESNGLAVVVSASARLDEATRAELDLVVLVDSRQFLREVRARGVVELSLVELPLRSARGRWELVLQPFLEWRFFDSHVIRSCSGFRNDLQAGAFLALRHVGT